MILFNDHFDYSRILTSPELWPPLIEEKKVQIDLYTGPLQSLYITTMTNA